MKKKINNYRFQQQQQAKKEYQKVKKIKEKVKKTPEDATEELEYMKKLLNGEDVGNFGPEEPVLIETNGSLYWTATHPMLSYGSSGSKMSLSELLSIGTIRQRKRI
tara:strand:+ start:259 stop:576 length:318 start_codon:yes stop_codon:yes gene_type:complete